MEKNVWFYKFRKDLATFFYFLKDYTILTTMALFYIFYTFVNSEINTDTDISDRLCHI